jgi:hypothetical protein
MTAEATPVSPLLDLQTVLESDLWGITDFNNELKEVDLLVQKCHQIKGRLTSITRTVGPTISSSMLLVQFQKWRTKKLKNQIALSLENLLPKVVYVEESIRMWFEAIVMKKWNVRHEAFQSIKDLGLLLIRYSRQRDLNTESGEECRETISSLRTFVQLRNEELKFLEVFSFLPPLSHSISVALPLSLSLCSLPLSLLSVSASVSLLFTLLTGGRNGKRI